MRLRQRLLRLEGRLPAAADLDRLADAVIRVVTASLAAGTAEALPQVQGSHMMTANDFIRAIIRAGGP